MSIAFNQNKGNKSLAQKTNYDAADKKNGTRCWKLVTTKLSL